MAFKFAFETLLKHRERLEDQARRDYLQAQADLNEKLGEIREMYNQVDATRKGIHQAEESGQAPELRKISGGHEFIRGQAIRIEHERQRARELMQVLEEKHQVLVEAGRQRMTLEKLKEKRWAEYKTKQKKREAKVVDELVTMRFKRSQRK